ncbi:general secretion pathway protein GspK [Candidatus Contendibacter odensensis]|nr:type II secretion system protein GspK [Candidatus Contendobacter odensis]MBK8750410.1 general secretion pathway protein GspK [Candidatus Competibacteraceae bacterium]
MDQYSRCSTGQRGMVLVIVLWIVTLLAVMAGGFAYSMRVETRLATSAVERAQARALAEAGVAYALTWQLDPEVQKQWPPNGDPHEWMFGNGRLRIEVTNAGGLVNLNTADAELLKALLKTAGVATGDQDRMVEAILDWRRNPGDQQMLGVGSTTTAGPKIAPFESLDELGQILGITRELHERLAHMATVYSFHYGVNPELAPIQVLPALGLDERTIADYVQARARAAADGSSPPPSLPQGNNPSFFSQSRSTVYHIAVAAETGPGTAVTVKAVFDTQSGTSGRGLRLLSWREGW